MPFVSVLHTSSSRLLLSNQDKGCTPSVAHSLPLPLGPALLSLWTVTEEEDKINEEKKVEEALKICGYPTWAFEKVKQQMESGKQKSVAKQKGDGERCKGMVVIPYVKGTSERMSRLYKSYNIASAMKPHTTLRRELVHPKDKRDCYNTTHALYNIPCLNCELCYIGETGRKFGTRLDEHKAEVNKVSNTVTTRAGRKESLSTVHKSAITDHVVEHNHVIGWGEAKVIGTEQDRFKRWVKEAVEIRKKRGTTMNRDEGQYHLSHIFDELLISSSRKSPKEKGKSTGNSKIGAGIHTSVSHQ